MNSFFQNISLFTKLYLSFVPFIVSYANRGDFTQPVGSISILLPDATPVAPHYTIASYGLKGNVVFRGQVESTTGNELVFDRIPDLLDPTNLSWPFKDGMLSNQKARASVTIASDKSIGSIAVDFGGAGYLIEPEVFISVPSDANSLVGSYEQAFATAKIDSGVVSEIIIDANYSGKGYDQNTTIEIEGGIHFVRCVEDGNYSGKFYRILSNTGDTLVLENTLNEDLGLVFSSNAMVEIFEASTLGSLFGYSATELKMGGLSVADYVYVLKPPGEQNGSVSDYRSYHHDGNYWKDTNGSSLDASDTVIYPDKSFILARRSDRNSVNSFLEITLSGVALMQDSFVHIPAKDERALINNPFGLDTMLSDLIPAENITLDSNETKKWLASENKEEADNVDVLHEGVWTTYWHDGTNVGVVENAYLTARTATGVAGSMTLQDISMSAGEITSMTNPLSGNIVVTSQSHSLRNGFTVLISDAYGHKTNDDSPKSQVDEDGNIVPAGQGLEILSGANGYFEITNVTNDTFEIVDKSGDCDFFGTANWKTGSSGSGYTSDAYISFVGGGGSGAFGLAKVKNGSVSSISLIDSGFGYTSASKAYIHSGGWRQLGAGNAPYNDVLIPAGSGILLTRNHPYGEGSTLRVDNPLVR
jgi:hypothetical protein